MEYALLAQKDMFPTLANPSRKPQEYPTSYCSPNQLEFRFAVESSVFTETTQQKT